MSEHEDENANHEFDAFISYRRRDGSAVAAWLYRALLEYRLPPELQNGRPDRLDVFMDVVYESASEDFWKYSVRPRLLAARRLVVISSPAAHAVLPSGRPNWLVREIETYLAERPQPQISVVIGAGEFDADLPGDLSARYPNIDRVDLRSSRFGRRLLPAVRRRLTSGLVTLVAAVHQITPAEMPLLRRWDEQQRQRRRFVTMLASAIVLAVVGVLLLLSAFAAANDRRDAVAAATLRGRAIFDERPAEARVHFAKAVADANRWWPPFAREEAADARAWIGQWYGEAPVVYFDADVLDDDGSLDVDHDHVLLRDSSGLYLRRLSTGEILGSVPCGRLSTGGYLDRRGWIIVPGEDSPHRFGCAMSVDGKTTYDSLRGAGLSIHASAGLEVQATHADDGYRTRLSSLRTHAPIGPELISKPGSLSTEFSETGRWLAVCDDARLRLVDSTGFVHLDEPSRGRCDRERRRFAMSDTRFILDDGETRLRVFRLPSMVPAIEIVREYQAPWAVDTTGRYLAVALDQHRIGLWDLLQNRRLSVATIASSANLDRIVVTGREPRVVVLDRDKGIHLVIGGLETRRWVSPKADLSPTIYEFRPSANGARVAARLSNELVVWTLGTDAAPTIVRHAEDITAFDFDSTGAVIATGSNDNTVRVWNASDGTPAFGPFEHASPVSGVKFLSSSKLVSWADRTIYVWPLSYSTSPTRVTGRVANVAVSTDISSPRIAAISDTGAVRLVDLDGTEHGRFLHQGCRPPSAGTTNEAIANFADRYVRSLYEGDATAAYSIDAKWLMTWRCDSSAMIWNAQTAQPQARLVHATRVLAAAFSPSGHLAITSAADGSARLWDVPSGRQIGATLAGEPRPVGVAISPDDRIAVTATESAIRFWNVATDSLLLDEPANGGLIAAVEFSADSRRLLVRHTGEIRVYDARMTRRPYVLAVPGITSAHFDSRASRIVVGSRDNTARVYDAKTGRALGAPMVHRTDVVDARFGVGDTRVVTAAGNSVQVWDAATGRAIGRPLPHTETCSSATFTASGSHVVALCGTVYVWRWQSDTASASEIVRRAEAATGFTVDPVSSVVTPLSAADWARRVEAARRRP